jgi:thiamine-monophosphate kinase
MSSSRQSEQTAGDLGEFGLIARISELLPRKSPRLLAGIGDDTCAFLPPEGRCLLLTTDAMVEGVHFRPEWGTWRQMGKKAMASSLSDVAAMGGRALFALVTLGVKAKTPVSAIEEVYAGMLEAGKQMGIEICGGDTVRSPAGVLVDVTILGECLGAGPIMRSGAKPGDLLLLTGSLGSSRAGLEVLQRGYAGAEGAHKPSLGDVPETVIQEALKAHLEPEARCEEGMALGESGLAHSMIDISDGLLADLEHICTASDVGAEVESEKVPLSDCCSVLAATLGEDALEWALEGGEEYELLFTCSPEKYEEIMELVRRATGTPVTVVGRITETKDIIVHSYRRRAGPGGYRHF